MTAMPVRRLGLYCGLVGPVVWLGLIAAAGALTPDFNHVTHYISELGARGSDTEIVMRYGGFGFTGLLYVGFAAALLAGFGDAWPGRVAALLIVLDGVGRMGAGAFPCAPGCEPVAQGPDLHKVFATIGFSSGVLAALVWGAVMRRLPPLRSLWRFSVGCGVAALACLLVMSFATNPVVPRGLLEHAATLVLSIWLMVFAGALIDLERPGGAAGRVRAAG